MAKKQSIDSQYAEMLNDFVALNQRLMELDDVTLDGLIRVELDGRKRAYVLRRLVQRLYAVRKRAFMREILAKAR